MCGYSEVVQILLEAGANVNVRNDDGWTVLKYAKDRGHYGILRLIKQGICK